MGTSVEVKIYDNPRKVVKALAKKIYKITNELTQPKINIALSGGKTPGLLFEVIALKYTSEIPWGRIHFWWGDERCVPPESDESNYRMAYDKLISWVTIPKENIHRIKGEEIPEKEAARYSDEIAASLNTRGKRPVFDLIILGLGNDGHTASIFPNQIELFNNVENCAVVEHPVTKQKRITLTGNVLNNANRIFFLVTGKNKAIRVSEIMNDETAAKLLPAYYVEAVHGELTWYIDQDAASMIA
jgi:6-phosphogluconolactonase